MTTNTTTALAPAYYSEFQCIGPDCEESCCIGWRVDLDKKTFHFYKQNQLKALRQRFADAVKRRTNGDSSDRQFGVIEMDASGRCPFLDTDSLCAIQKNLGANALSITCATYPRHRNRFGGQSEYSMSLSCPEVARLALLDPTPMRFVEIPHDPAFREVPSVESFSDAEQQAIVVYGDLRALSIAILQARELSIDNRLILLGLLLEDFEAAGLHGDAARTAPARSEVLQHYVLLLGNLSALQGEIARIKPDTTLQINLVTAIVQALLPLLSNRNFVEHLLQSAKGLDFAANEAITPAAYIARYDQAYQALYTPFFAEHGHILENYLVHYAFVTHFPLTESTLAAHYRTLLGNYLTLRTLLLGQAQFHGGLTEQRVVRTIQSFTRFAGHSEKYKPTLQSVLAERGLIDIPRFFPLLAR